MAKKIILTILSIVLIFGITKPASALTIDDLKAMILQLQQQITDLQKQLNTSSSSEAGKTAWCHTFNFNLRYGDSGTEVNNLQTALTKDGFSILVQEDMSNTFGDHTAAAVVQFQEKYITEILSPYKLTRGTGFVGGSTRAKLNKLYGCATDKPVDVDAPQTVNPAITILSPNGGERYVLGNSYQIKVSCNKGVDKNINIYLIDKSGTSKTLFSDTPCAQDRTNFFSWSISSDSQTGESVFKIKVETTDATTTDESDNYFSITKANCTDSDGGENYYVKGTTMGLNISDKLSTDSDYCSGSNLVVEWICLPELRGLKNAYRESTSFYCPYGCLNGACLMKPATIKVLTPNGGEKLARNSYYNIQWQTYGVDYVTITLVSSTGNQYMIAKDIAGSASVFTWKVPSDTAVIPNGNYKISITSMLANDTSDNNFSVGSGSSGGGGVFQF